MNTYKLKIVLIIGIPIALISLWGLALFNILFSNKNKTSIIEFKKKNEISKKQTDINKNNIKHPPLKQSHQKKSNITILNVYIPKKFKTLGFEKIKHNLRKKNIIVKVVYNLNDNQLLRYLASKKLDIALIPSTKIYKFKNLSYEVNFNNQINLNSIFHFIFNNFFQKNKTFFIPYCIDPSATILSPDITISKINLENIKNYFINYPKKIKKITVNIGLDDLIVKLYLTKNKYPYPNFYNTLYMLLYYSTLNQNSSIVSTIKERSTNEYIKLFSSITLIKFSHKYKKNKDNLDIYLGKVKKIKIIFGFLSDINELKNWKTNIFPNEDTNIYFVKGRGFIINKKTKNLSESLYFINEYLKQGFNGNLQLWNNCLSAFNNIYEKQKFIKKYLPFTNYEENFILLTDTKKKLEKILKNTKFLNAIKGEYSLKALYETSNFPEIVLEN